MKQLAICREYHEFIDAINARITELGTTMDTIDYVAGLPLRYTQKLTGPRPIKTLGRLSFGPLLGALGLAIIVVDDEEQLGKLRHRLTARRQKAHEHSAAVHYRLSRRFLLKIARLGGLNSRKKVSRRRASQLGRRAAKARWKKVVTEVAM